MSARCTNCSQLRAVVVDDARALQGMRRAVDAMSSLLALALAALGSERRRRELAEAGAAAMREVVTGNLRCLWCDQPGDGHLPGCRVARALDSDAGRELLEQLDAARNQITAMTEARPAGAGEVPR